MRVNGFEHYELNGETGTCYNHKTGRYVGSLNEKTGYVSLSLSNGKLQRNVYLHRLMVEHSIPNPDNKEQVHHINEDKTDNRVENLEWVTTLENNTTGTRLDRVAKSQGKAIRVWNNENSYKFWSIHEASRQLNLNQANLTSVLVGRLHTTRGYRAEYLEEI